MKVFLCLVIVVLIVLCAWIRFTATRPTEAHRVIISGLKAELEDSRAEFDTANEALDTAKAEIEGLKRRIASLETAAVARSFSNEGNSAAVPPAGSSPPVAAAAPSLPPTPSHPVAGRQPGGATLAIRLSELKATFDAHRLSIENRKALLESDLAALNSKRRSVANTELHFSEQSTRVDLEGNVLGNRGVRTSTADRERAQAKVADQVAEVDREIARKQTEINRVAGEMDSLRENYSKALVRANEEFGVKSSPTFGN
jgi:predicted  nucleic acid-binding Zn-ribbon protein